MSADRFTEHYRLLSTNPAMRAALLADPKAALAAYFGSVVDGAYRIEVIEQRADTITAVIPAPPGPGVDPAARLADVSGRIYDMLHSSGIGGYLIPDEALTWVLRDMRALWAGGDGADDADSSTPGS
ncbi:hypothetical protein M2163_001035 [Streptomyces sp. SAI-135]|jgi:hypothetical protein|uniref:hypothetical protein n=1 Tax=unclassified Streptomyces TaxID=2593676 RepID=UPI002473F1EF|nr:MULTISPECIES: hypothetical protein [unclassified Streptomyces]MDH6521971.1 hypothetical protein [Streptomyces sp. SAI-090]MDH6573340.1 hypothetical protein [Streptomyces sp. SAI-117]MDH6613927.1 hypothetical protein [Streptomyces sp. SAI-135]